MTGSRPPAGPEAGGTPGTEPGRFYFSVRCRDRLLEDREGVALGPGADVRQCALFLADRLRSDQALADLPLEGCSVEVSDARGGHLLTVFLTS